MIVDKINLGDSLNKNYLFLLVILFFSCSKDCKIQLEQKLINNLSESKLVVFEDETEEWKIIDLKENSRIGSRFYYTIYLQPERKSLLINHKIVEKDQISQVIEKEASELLKRFENEGLEKTPKVGFQIIYSKNSNYNDIEIAKMICLIKDDVVKVKNNLKINAGLDENTLKIDKILQYHFYLIKE